MELAYAQRAYIPVRYGTSCGCAACLQGRIDHVIDDGRKEAVERAEMLLRQYLTSEQLEDWEAHGSFIVKGSLGNRFRLTPHHSGFHKSVIREDNLGIAVWPIGLDIAADWALAMMLRLEAHEQLVVETGCHSKIPFEGALRLP